MEFILLNSYGNYVEAHIAKGVLEEEGIVCWLKDENTVTIDPILTNAVGGIKLMVAKPDAQRAWELLTALQKEQQQKISCPKCGAHQVELVSTPRKLSNWASAIIGFFITSYAMPVDKVWHCFDCGHEFRSETNEEDKTIPS